MDNAEYIEFLEPRGHLALTDKWVVSSFIPGQREPHDHTYLHDSGETYQVYIHLNSESIEPTDIVSDIVHKLLEPQIIPDTFLLWEVVSADNPNFALSDSNSIVHVAYRAHFYTFQSALFAKLRYERTHRDIMY